MVGITSMSQMALQWCSARQSAHGIALPYFLLLVLSLSFILPIEIMYLEY
jgi:hypothetical protein